MEKKNFNNANIPFLMTISIFGVILILLFLACVFQSNILFMLLMLLSIVFILLLCLACPIGLIFQLLDKNKTKFDKILIGLNCTSVIFTILAIVLLFFAFPNIRVNEKQVIEQIKQESAILNKEYQPVLNYLAKYKKENGIYPDKIDEKIIPASNTFDTYKYHTNLDGKGYWLQVYPKKGAIEYYYNDENDKGYNYYQGNGYIDGAFDNDNFYEIDEKWHAVKLDLFTRHSFLFNYGKIESETDEWMKDNIEKLERNK